MGYFSNEMTKMVPQTAVQNTSAPTFAGIVSATANSDGSITATWAAASGPGATPIRYKVYAAPGASVSPSSLFVGSNIVEEAPSTWTMARFYQLGDQTTFFNPGSTYTVGVRAFSAENITETNTITTNVTVTSANFNTLAFSVWEQLKSAHTSVGTFGYLLDAQVSLTQTAATALSQYNSLASDILAIPTNPLLTTDSRLNHLDADISTRNSTAHFDSIIGTPANASIAADIAEVESETDGIAAIPTNPLLTTDSRLNYLDIAISSRVATTHFDSIIGTPANASIAADLAEIEAETDGIAAIPTNPVLTTDSRLNYLDAPISGTQTAATALSQYNTVVAGLVTIEGDIAAIPTNPVLTTDPRLNYLDIAVSSRSTQTSVNTLQTTANNIQNLVILTL